MEIERVYCAVGTGTSNTFQTEWNIQSVTLWMLRSDGKFFSFLQQIFLSPVYLLQWAVHRRRMQVSKMVVLVNIQLFDFTLVN